MCIVQQFNAFENENVALYHRCVLCPFTRWQQCVSA